MLESRIGEDADGESRMIGSGRRDELDPGFLARGSPAEGAGTTGMGRLPGFAPAAYAPVREERLRPRKISAVLRTCEKSYLFNQYHRIQKKKKKKKKHDGEIKRKQKHAPSA